MPHASRLGGEGSGRSTRSRFIGLLMAIGLAAGSATAAACPTEAENEALFIRSLQTELMVAALTCGTRDSYNEFAVKFRDVLVENGKLIKVYFARERGGRRELDRFITALANEASELSMARGATFCDGVDAMFEQVLALPSWAASPW